MTVQVRQGVRVRLVVSRRVTLTLSALTMPPDSAVNAPPPTLATATSVSGQVT